ncbi:aldo/keto reductase [Nesterenkonia sp. Act20]|uniref:aldo/keto reductase n=1 Tax=Nesterenkonia sp. Act20 TaxID=1483432 RepID=UPI001C462FC7|nr:aldo/keto reductase [Nesterenkonia sp. Act20]
MEYRSFGRTGIQLSAVSYGAMRLTGDAAHVARSRKLTSAEIENENASGESALETALDAGVNCIHSSQDYGTWWMLEKVLRRRKLRDEVHHVIKVTTPDYAEDYFDARLVRSEVENALKTLGAERISFVQHLQRGPQVNKYDAYSTAGDERRIAAADSIAHQFAQIMAELRNEGKVAHGVTFPHTIPFAAAALRTGAYAGTAHFLNALEPEALDLLDRERGRTGFFGIRPLLQGLLTDKRIDRGALPQEDSKRSPAWDTRYEAIERLRTTVSPDSWTDWALRFSLSHPGVSSVIVSARNSAQMDAILNAAEQGPLEQDEFTRAVTAVREGPRLPKSDIFVENLV